MGQQEPDALQQGEVQSPVLGEEHPQVLVQAGCFPAAAAVHRKDWGALMETRLSKSQPCALVAKKAPDTVGCFRQSSASRGEGDPSPPLSTGETNVRCCVQCWPPSVQEMWI